MSNVKISMIAALQEHNRGLGKNNDLLFKIHADLAWFKKITAGHPVIMGRKTYESIGRPLPNRTNIVITQDTKWSTDGTLVVHSLEEALDQARKIEKEEVFIIGGGTIYTQSLPYADRLYLTLVDGNQDADVFFPSYENEFQHVIEQTEKTLDPTSGYYYHHIILERK